MPLQGGIPAFARESVEEAFTPAHEGGPVLIGAEVELIPVDRETRRPPRLAASGITITRRASVAANWTEEQRDQRGTPSFRTPTGRITFEPGGQIEFSAVPCTSISALVYHLQDTAYCLTSAADRVGVDLLTVGIDPDCPLEETRLVSTAERYRRMNDYFASLGPNGARMMRQTAAMQICLDLGPAPARRWALLNALAPVMAAVFANSPMYDGRSTGHESFRRHMWATLDPSRTGVFEDTQDVVEQYLRFALDASAFLCGDDSRLAAPAAVLLDAGEMGPDQWRDHLSTLFPEVRPRGYFEVRTADALPPEWYAAPLVFLAGLVLDEENAATIPMLLSAPSTTGLARAGRVGLRDDEMAKLSSHLAHRALGGCRRLGREFADARDLEAAESFFQRFTWRGLSPSAEAAGIVPV